MDRWDMQSTRLRQSYDVRIEALRNDAEAEGFAVNPASEMDFWSFFDSAPLAQKASVVLMDSGNLRAVWKAPDGSHLGIQFLGNSQAEYVIFKRRAASQNVSRVAGIDTLDGIKKQICSFDLASLLKT